MTSSRPSWGLVSTVKASNPAILRFCAHHLSLGATRIYLFLDDPDAQITECLTAHPQIDVIRCDATYWDNRNVRRPIKHQVRQTMNATHAYALAADVDWLAHIDVDEFLMPESSVTQELSTLPKEAICARVTPVEVLADTQELFKRKVPKGPDYHAIMAQIYPRFGHLVKAGFLSHVQGKLFVKTGVSGIRYRIHNILKDGESNPGLVQLDGMELAHFHAPSWAEFLSSYEFRLRKGSYRADLKPNFPRDVGGVTLHEALTTLEIEQGTAGLREFYEEMSTPRQELVSKLETHGLLKRRLLSPDKAVADLFPGEN